MLTVRDTSGFDTESEVVTRYAIWGTAGERLSQYLGARASIEYATMVLGWWHETAKYGPSAVQIHNGHGFDLWEWSPPVTGRIETTFTINTPHQIHPDDVARIKARLVVEFSEWDDVTVELDGVTVR